MRVKVALAAPSARDAVCLTTFDQIERLERPAEVDLMLAVVIKDAPMTEDDHNVAEIHYDEYDETALKKTPFIKTLKDLLSTNGRRVSTRLHYVRSKAYGG